MSEYDFYVIFLTVCINRELLFYIDGVISLKLFSNSITSLEQGLNTASLRQKTIANNIANAETPNYKAKKVKFSKILEESENSFKANRTDVRHIPFSSSLSTRTAIINQPGSYNENGNSVDLDAEMSSLAENQIYYNALADRLSSKFSSLSNVIRGGR